MENLNRIVPFVLAGIVAVAFFVNGGSFSAPPEDPWFKSAVLENSRPVVVKFGADWCGPCRGMDSALNSIAPQFASRARFLRISIDQKPEIFRHYASGSGIPQIMVFRNGRVVASQLGFGGRDALQSWLASHL